MSEEVKRKRREAKVISPAMPSVNPEVAQRHIAAYYFALYGGCDCEACQLLRPIAKKMTFNLKKESEKHG